MADSILSKLTATSLFDLRGAAIVVTGGGTGIGLMISATLIANGATVYITGRRLEVLEKTAQTYNAAALKTPGFGKLIPIQADISLKAEAARLADELAKREPGGITVLVNNAGAYAGQVTHPTEATAAAYRAAYFDGISPDDFATTTNTNVVGPYFLTFAFLPLLEKWKESPLAQRLPPQVIMITSMGAYLKDTAPGGNSFPYLLSKSAQTQSTASLARQLLPLGVRVNAIAPGAFATPLATGGKQPNETGQVTYDGGSASFEVPATQEGGKATDIGPIALALISNWFINGEVVLLDGGSLLKLPGTY
ncbi:NAD(P)-binding protein [Gloeopeniophorella convolvens]|nr:NAD(P)-binding protein [Gloeopeniophorella convolvens]